MEPHPPAVRARRFHLPPGNIIYNVNLTVGAGSVTGDIVTDGTIGDLGLSNIVDWNLLLNDGVTTSGLLGPLSGSNLRRRRSRLGFVSNGNQLQFDFSNPPGSVWFSSNGAQADVYFRLGELPNRRSAGVTLTIGRTTFQRTVLSGTQVIATAATTGTASQTITFGALNNVILGPPPFAISATASSGLPVTFASTTASVCTVSGNTVTIVAVGTCSITASQAGNATYAAAVPVTQSFLVSSSAAGLYLVSGNHQSGLPNQEFPEPVVFQLLDTNQNPVPGAVVSFAVPYGYATLGETSAVTNVQGQVSASVIAGSLYPGL